MEQNPNWVDQGNGMFLPAPELLERIRQNPSAFPNAQEDIARMSGMRLEEVAAALANQGRIGGDVSTNPIADTFASAGRGLGKGIGIALDKIGIGGDGVRDATNFNPGFASEQGLHEQIGEVAGQIVPGVAAAVAAAPAALAAGGGALATTGAGVVTGAIATTLTFEDEDNLFNMVDDLTDGAAPDFLVVDDLDDEGTAFMKHMAGNLIVDLALGGLGHGVAKVWRLMKGGKATPEALQAIADEAGVALKETPVAPQTVEKATARVAQGHMDELVPEAGLVAKRASVAQERVANEVAARAAGQLYEPSVVDPDLAKGFVQNVLGPVQRNINRSKEVNVGRRATMEAVESNMGKVFEDHAMEVLRAITNRQADEVVRLVRQVDKLAGNQASTIGHVYKTSLLREAMNQMDANFEQIILAIRKDPKLKTNAVWKQMAADFHGDKVKLAEMYREIGSSSSYAFLTRKGVKFDDTLVKRLADYEDDLVKQLKTDGYNLFSSRAEYVASKAMGLEEMGFDTVEVIGDLYRMFDEFDAARQGTIDSMKHSTKLSKAEREALEGSFMRMVQDLHSSALLGQPSTAGLEIMSNTINNLLLPFTQHVLTKGNVVRAFREYAGYAAATSRGWKTFKAAYVKGKSVTDDFDILDGAHAAKLDYEVAIERGQHVKHLLTRLWKFAADLSIAASESQKAWRGMGVAYADGYQLALRSGMKKPEARKKALEYANAQFTPDGAFRDSALKLDVAETSWQSAFDTRYVTGKFSQGIDNLRNHKNPMLSMVSRAAMPFFRTLVNIQSHSLQTIQPIPASVLAPLSRTKWGAKFTGTAKFLDDFTGKNGLAAKARAVGRQRLGYMTMAGGYALMEAGKIQITGPSGYKRYDAKTAETQEFPGSSLIVGNTSIDLTRLLPFSAPLLLLGTMSDMEQEQKLQMRNGNWVAESDSAVDVAATYGSALGYLTMAMMSDAASFRGVGDLFDAVNKAAAEGDPRALADFGKAYVKQYTPGLLRTAGKNQGYVTGDWTQDEAEGFLNEMLASAGFHTGWTRLDFLGNPYEVKNRGLDPLNMKPVHTDDELRQEYIMLNRAGDLGLVLGRPTDVFDRTFWKELGAIPTGMQWLTRTDVPSLNDMKTTDGRNAWEVYRETVYKGEATKDIEVSVPNIGKVSILQGENWETSIRRITSTEGYTNLTPEARVQVWRAVFGKFKKDAKEKVKNEVVVDPAIFSQNTYGNPTPSEGMTIGEVQAAGKAIKQDVLTTRGSPLDEAFAIK